MTGVAADLARVRTALDANPRLRAVFEDLFAVLADATSAVAVSGSVERGEVDPYSDLDLLVVADDAEVRRAALHAHLYRRYEVVALFDAAHLGLDCLDSVFVVADGRIVKIDVTWWSSRRGPAPVGGLVVHDPAGVAVRRGDPGDEVARAPVDLPGWTCHVRKIIARGELFESAHCLNEMRRRFLVPVLLELHGAEQVNYRRIEQRLPGPTLDLLRRTYPGQLSPPALSAALAALVDAFAEAYARLPAGRRTVDLAQFSHRLRLARSTPVS